LPPSGDEKRKSAVPAFSRGRAQLREALQLPKQQAQEAAQDGSP